CFGHDIGVEMIIYLLYSITILYLKAVPVLSEEQRADFNQLELVMTKEFISQQLIHLIGCLDTNEEGSRKQVLAVLQEMLSLPHTPFSLVSLLTEKLLTLIPDDQRRIQCVAEIISDVREPIIEASHVIDENLSRRQQLAEVKVQIMEVKQALEDCISAQEFNRAAELKDSITELENRRNQILQEIAESNQPADKETRAEKNDPETLLRCLAMFAELLKQMNIKSRIGPTISALMSSLVLPSIANAHPAVRNMAVVCLGTCALHSMELAKTHMVLLLQIAQLDEVRIRISAVQAIIDLLLMFGFQLLSDTTILHTTPASQSPERQEDDAPSDDKMETQEDSAQSTLVMLSEFLDSEVTDLRTEAAEGIAKLLYTGRIASAKMFSRLVLLWYNPVTEDDTRLRHCLGVFFQLYARESRAHQEVIENSFLPTVRTLLNAPVTSPLAEVDINNVVELLVELTRHSALIKPSTNTEEACVHDYLAAHMCGEMLKDPSAPEVRLYAKTLCNLELSQDETVKKDLHTLLQELVQDRVCLRALEKMMAQLVDSKEQAEMLSASALQPLDVNDGTDMNTVKHICATCRLTLKGNGLVSINLCMVKKKKTFFCSDGENVPESVPSVRPSRRAKAAALEKTKLDLNPLINQEVS
uniref:UVR domain-containing protein n=1 Tax=Periophthalmus magnuspinnatus TaxID=409849 RepID=A0A3B4B2L3_9GOBI